MSNSDFQSNDNLNEEVKVSDQVPESPILDPATFPHNVAENKRRRNNSVMITIIICATVIVLCILGFILYYAVSEKEHSSQEDEDRIERTDDRDYDRDRSETSSDEGYQNPSENIVMRTAQNSGRAGEPVDGRAISRREVEAILSDVGLTDDYSYIICEVKLQDSDLQYLNKAQLRILRNTIYARHGRKFASADLRNYFSRFSWYNPIYDEISPNALSQIEKHNIQLIQKYE